MLPTDPAFLQAILFPTLYFTPFPLVPVMLSSSIPTQLMTLLPTLLSKYKFHRYYHFYPTFNLHPYVLPFHLYCNQTTLSQVSLPTCELELISSHSPTQEHCCTTLLTLFKLSSFLSTELLSLRLGSCYFSFSGIQSWCQQQPFPAKLRKWSVLAVHRGAKVGCNC